MYKEGDEEHYGAMLMGMESDAHGVMNQMGHTHEVGAGDYPVDDSAREENAGVAVTAG